MSDNNLIYQYRITIGDRGTKTKEVGGFLIAHSLSGAAVNLEQGFEDNLINVLFLECIAPLREEGIYYTSTSEEYAVLEECLEKIKKEAQWSS